MNPSNQRALRDDLMLASWIGAYLVAMGMQWESNPQPMDQEDSFDPQDEDFFSDTSFEDEFEARWLYLDGSKDEASADNQHYA